MTQVSIHYFASLRDERGVASEMVDTDADSAGSLYDRIAGERLFTLDRSRVRLAVNDEFSDWNTPLSNGDRIVFIPPVAGG